MDYLLEVSLILLAALVHATLQLGLGALLLLYHASLGKHVRGRTKALVGSFVAGFGLLTLFLLCTTCFLIESLAGADLAPEYLMVVVGILVALAICVWFFYYRRGRSTELWLPKSVARYISRRAKVTESNTEAFALGMLASFAELPISVALLVVAASGVVALPDFLHGLVVVGYTLITILPLIILRATIRHGKTVVDVQRWRVKNKTFLRLVAGASLIILAGFLLAFKVMGQ